MADRPAESIKVSCALCGETFFVPAKERSSASCPACDEPISAPASGIVKRRDRKKSVPGIVEKKASSTFIGVPMAGADSKLDEEEEKPDPSAFKEALAMSRIDMELDLDDAFFEPPDPFEFGSNEPTVAISLQSDVNDQTKPPPGILKRHKKKKNLKDAPTIERNAEPITIPMTVPATEPASDAATVTDAPESLSESSETKRKFRKGMRTSQLSDLLKKAKKEKQKEQKPSLPKPSIIRPPKIPAKTRIGAINLNKSPTKPVINVPKSIKATLPEPKEDSLLIQLQALDKKLAPTPGQASENRGSGFIKLPTTDILDVLGTGQYRLRVQDIIYEPVDEKGLTQLIKGGVLLGAEDIAEANGDWMPISEHPVFSGLRKRMAKEAHSLLSKVAPGKPEIKELEVREDIDQSSDIDLFAIAPQIETQELEAPPLEDEKPATTHTMQMFAMDRNAVDSLITPSLANSIDNLDEEAPLIDAELLEENDEAEIPKTEDQTVEKVFLDPSSVGETNESDGGDKLESMDSDESELELLPKKKSAMGIFLAIILLGGALVAGVLYANSQGLLDFSQFSSQQAEVKTPNKTEDKNTKKLVKEEPSKKIAAEKVIAPKKEDPKKELVAEKTKVETVEKVEKTEVEKIEKTEKAPTLLAEKIEVGSFEGAKFVRKASGKNLAMIFEKDGASFLLVPETEKGALGRILAAQKLCKLLDCPFAQNKVKTLTISVAQLKASGASQDASIRVVDGKINALTQAISKDSFSISATGFWRPILRASKSARQIDLGKLKEKGMSSNKVFARQLGSILLLDFLINDWNRFESKPSHIGIERGQLVNQGSIVAFEPRASGRVKGRFGWSSVYPAEMVEKLQKLERQATLEFLFPNASTTDKSRFNVFWKQRTNALERIKTLSAKSGKENVLLSK